MTHSAQPILISTLTENDNIIMDNSTSDLSDSDISLAFVLSIFNGDHQQFADNLNKHFDTDGKRILDWSRLEQHIRQPSQIVYRNIREIFLNCLTVLSTYDKSTDVVDFFLEHGQHQHICAEDIFCWNFYLPYPEVTHYLWSQGYTLSPQALYLREEGLGYFYQFVQEHDLPYFPVTHNKEESDANYQTIVCYRKYNEEHNQLKYSFNIENKLQQEQFLFHEQSKVQLYLKLKENLKVDTIDSIDAMNKEETKDNDIHPQDSHSHLNSDINSDINNNTDIDTSESQRMKGKI